MKKNKITVFTSFDEVFREIQSIVEPVNKKYFEKFNVEYLSYTENLNIFSSEKMSDKNKKYWVKMFILQDLLNKNLNTDWFFWIDSDAIILNHDFDINFFPDLAEQNKQFLVCETNQDYKSKFWNVNTGVFFVRNSEYMKEIIGDIISFAVENNFFNDQPIWQEMLMKNYKQLSDRTAIFPSHSFNHEGSFIYHICNFSTLDMDFETAMSKKTEFLKQIYNSSIK